MHKHIYLDYAAATPVDRQVLAVMSPFFSEDFYNPSATYLAGRAVHDRLNRARADVAQVLGAKPAEIIFTSGATEANNLAIQGIMKAFPDGELLVSAIEHQSVLAPADLFKHQLVLVTKSGLLDLSSLPKLINNRTVLISVILVNNEIGTIQPVSEVARIIKKVRQQRKSSGNNRPLYLHTDAAQAANYLDLHISRLGVDLMSLNGGKLYGPKQSGVLFVQAGTQLEPLILGGGQEFGLRSGTENVASAIGFAKALQLAQDKRSETLREITVLRDYFTEELKSSFPKAILNMSSKHQVPHIISITFPGADNERLMIELDEAGVSCAVGSACSASSDKPSHVLAAIGLSNNLARATLRFSLGRYTTRSDLRSTVRLLKRFIR